MARSPFNTNRGSVGGVVTQGGRFGPIQRERVTPVNPQTLFQQNQRAILAAVASEWRGLDPGQRAAWKALAAQMPGNITGFQAYVKINATRVTCGQAKLEDAPVIPAFGIMTCSGLTSAGGVVTLNDVADTVAPDKFMIEATPQSSQGIENRNAGFRLITVVAGAAGPADIDISAAYAARFGDLVADEEIAVRISAVKDGFKGVPLRFSAING